MSAKKDTAARRLKRAFEDSKERMKISPTVFAGALQISPETLEKIFNFDYDEVFLSTSRVALRLDTPNQADEPMLSAFAAAGLDHKNPMHWRMLVSMFAEVHFAKKGGRPKKWDEFTLIILRSDYEVLKRKAPHVNERAIAEKLHDAWEKKGLRPPSMSDFIKRLNQVKNWTTDEIVMKLYDPFLAPIRSKFERDGREMPDDWLKFYKDLVDQITNLLGGNTGRP